MIQDLSIRQSIIEHCLKMQEDGINQGTAGNISHRVEGGILVTPSGMPYHKMTPEDIVFISNEGEIEEGKIPSSEWRFHHSILMNNPDCNAVIHAHALYATMVSILGIDELPAIHYMVAICGANAVPCAEYATYGTEELNQNITAAMAQKKSKACILKNHGLVATEATMEKTYNLLCEIEFLCRVYMGVASVGTFTTLPDDEIVHVLEKFKSYGLNVKHPNKK